MIFFFPQEMQFCNFFKKEQMDYVILMLQFELLFVGDARM